MDTHHSIVHSPNSQGLLARAAVLLAKLNSSQVGEEDALELLYKTAEPLVDSKTALYLYKARQLQLDTPQSSVADIKHQADTPENKL